MTGRNPSYCFIDFTTRDMAVRVIQEYNGRIFMRRLLRVKPGVKARGDAGRSNARDRSIDPKPQSIQRWDSLEKAEDLIVASQEGQRLYVGGLPRFENQREAHEQIRGLFKDYTIRIISKPISAHESTRNLPGNHNYLFVDLESPEEATLAARNLDGISMWGWNLKVALASGAGTLGKVFERRRLCVGGLSRFPDQETTKLNIRELFEEYDVSTIGSLKVPEDIDESCFWFAELRNEADTDNALQDLNGKEKWDVQITVKPATTKKFGLKSTQ